MTPDDYWASVDKGDCWVWTGSVSGGYGRLWFAGRLQYAHRVSYGMLVGEVPTGLELDHLCRNTLCVNPEHLEPVSHRANMLRGISPPAVHAVKTVAKCGHPLGEARRGKRLCWDCQRDYQRSYMRRWRAERKVSA